MGAYERQYAHDAGKIADFLDSRCLQHVHRRMTKHERTQKEGLRKIVEFAEPNSSDEDESIRGLRATKTYIHDFGRKRHKSFSRMNKHSRSTMQICGLLIGRSISSSR